MEQDNELICQLYERVCRDSEFKLSTPAAAALVAGVLNILPMQVWLAYGSITKMDNISRGNIMT